MRNVPVIAIDGPSGSGKGTVAKRVAQILGFHYLDSGALYRLVALTASRAGLDLADEAAVADAARRLCARFEADEVMLAGERVTDAIRTEECSRDASKVAALPAVREALLERQRAFRQAPGLVADGRDMGTAVFPDARLKVFLTASPEERAQRRYKQLIGKGLYAIMDDLVQDIGERDRRDRERSSAPLHQAGDAYLLDTTALTVAQAVEEVVARYRAVAR